MLLAVRTWLRYVVPLSLLSAIVLAPILYMAMKVAAPTDVLHARAAIRRAWLLTACAGALQLLLVAGVAPAVRSLAAGAPLSQARAFGSGLLSLVQGFVPWLISIIAVLLGGLALVVPGVLLLVLVSMTGASASLSAPMPAAIEDSIAVAREQLPRIAMVVGMIIAIDVAVTYAAQLAWVPVIGKKVVVAKLAPILTFVRASSLVLAALAPLAACAIAATYSHAKRR